MSLNVYGTFPSRLIWALFSTSARISSRFAFSSSIVYVLRDRVIGYILYILLFIIVLVFVLKTNVLFEHKKGNKK